MTQPNSLASASSSTTSSVLINRTKSPSDDAVCVSNSDTFSPELGVRADSDGDQPLLLPEHGNERLSQEADIAWSTLEDITGLQFTLSCDMEVLADGLHQQSQSQDEDDVTGRGSPVGHVPNNTIAQDDGGLSTTAKTRKPFQKWMNTLRRRGVQRRRALGVENEVIRHLQDIGPEASGSIRSGHHHYRNSSSDSSLAFITGMKSPSVSLASFSLIGRSKKTTVRSSKAHSRTDHSSRASVSAFRASEESQGGSGINSGMPLEPAVAERSMQRRRILEELITTEESYIGDIRFLMNVYVTILASLPTQTAGLRSSINDNMTEIVELHEELLGELHRTVPHSEYTQIEPPPCGPRASMHGHRRLRSLDSVPEDDNGMSWLQTIPGMTVEPQVVAEVAKTFTSKMNRFFVYEEYGAKYELMMKDIGLARRTLPDWEKYQKGLEALAGSLNPENICGDQSKKSLTISDLLVKPIQRVCKYPLLFAELLKYTPVVDCPHSHMVIEDTLLRLREATGEINRATDDPQIKATLERSWLLQDRLAFPNQKLDAASKNRIRSFGHVRLCGALHVCWQTKDSVAGQYLICMLYREWLCIAAASRVDPIYTILFCISTANIKVEDADNGRGLQCHTAPFSWKLVFECDYQLYEIIMTACTPKEYQEWRSRLEQSTANNMSNTTETASFNALSLNIKSLGTVFGKPGTIARRISIHRATTVGPKSSLCQVILKNTSVEKDAAPVPTAKGLLNRSQSLLGPNGRIPIIAPSRGERARLEALLSDVWTREILPFPGMTVRARSEHLVRASASSVMRKLSINSIATTFSKRSVSLASMTKITSEDEASSTTSPAVEAQAVKADTGSPLWAAAAVAEEEQEQERESDPRATTSGEDTSADLSSGDVGEETSQVLQMKADDVVEELTLTQIKSYSDTAIDAVMRTSEHLQEPAERPATMRGPPHTIMTTTNATTSTIVAEHVRAISPANSSHPSEEQLSRHASKSPASATARQSPHIGGSPKGRLLPMPYESCKASSIKSVGRWAKVGARHRGVMVQGIRSFFR